MSSLRPQVPQAVRSVDRTQDSAANIVGESAEVCCERFEETEVEEEGGAADAPPDFFAEE